MAGWDVNKLSSIDGEVDYKKELMDLTDIIGSKLHKYCNYYCNDECYETCLVAEAKLEIDRRDPRVPKAYRPGN